MSLRIFHSVQEWSGSLDDCRSVLSIGNFDGLHLGHQQILHAVLAKARNAGVPPVVSPAPGLPAVEFRDRVAGVVTFDPHPMKVLRPESAPPLIETLPQRMAGFERMGLDAALVLKFDAGLSRLSPEQFVEEILVKALRAAAILVGGNFRFGHRQAGDVDLLRGLGQKFNFEVDVVPPVTVDGQAVSSTAVRDAVRSGDVTRAARLLGRPFALTGEIRAGAGRGRAMLFPTLNLAPEQELLPRSGVYITETLLSGKTYGSATNVGTRPTVDGGALGVESHLFGFSGESAAERIEVRFHQRLRDEMKFESVDALRAQIARDLETAQEFFRAQNSRLR